MQGRHLPAGQSQVQEARNNFKSCPHSKSAKKASDKRSAVYRMLFLYQPQLKVSNNQIYWHRGYPPPQQSKVRIKRLDDVD